MSEVTDTVAAGGVKDKGEVKGLITNLLDFAVHDGPGLRVIVFFKGCMLRCGWCQNPENMMPKAEIEYHESLCLECLHCLKVCPVPGAIVLDKHVRIDRSKCTRCMRCVEECPGMALRSVGVEVTVEEVMDRLIRYKPFFDRSDRGGVTLSGGDPLFQPEFTLALLQACRQSGIHTAIETCGFAPYEILKKVGQAADLVIYDIKHMDDAAHIKGTDRSNRLILDNLAKFCRETETEVAIHLPLICGFNDDEENVRRTAEFVKSLKRVNHIDLLPFNDLACAKYKMMGLGWQYADIQQQPREPLEKLKSIVESYGLEATIGGLW